MSKNLPPPIPALLPESAPFTVEQRAWLNGFFAGYLGLDNGGVTALSPEESAKLMSGVARWASQAASSRSIRGGRSSNATDWAYSRAIACSAVEAAPPPI